MLDDLGGFSNWRSLDGALGHQSEGANHLQTLLSDSLWKSNILAIPHFSKMDSKRDHRGGHRNIYDQIDLEIINSKGPGSEKSMNPKYQEKLKSLFSSFLRKMFSRKFL